VFIGNNHSFKSPSGGEVKGKGGVAWFGGKHIPCKEGV